MGFAPLIGMGIQAVQSLRQGREEKKQAEYNADLIDIQATDLRRQANADKGRVFEDYSRIEGAAKAVAAANGITMESGSVAQQFASSRMAAERDALQLMNNAARAAWGLEVEAYNTRARGSWAGQQGKQVAAANVLQMGGEAYKLYKGRG